MAASSRKISKNRDDVSLMKEGLVGAIADGAIFELGGKTLTKEQIIAKFVVWEGSHKQVAQKEAELAEFRTLRDGNVVESVSFLDLLKPALLSRLGPDSAKLAACGIAPRKPTTPLSAEAMALRVARANATRQARGTVGPKQKSKIHGVVPAPANNGGTSH